MQSVVANGFLLWGLRAKAHQILKVLSLHDVTTHDGWGFRPTDDEVGVMRSLSIPGI